MEKLFLSLLLGVVLLASPSQAFESAEARPVVHEELVHAWGEFARSLHDWGGRLRHHFGGSASREEQPLVSLMLRHREKLELSTKQVEKLERLRSDYQRAAIRNDANLRIAEMDLEDLLEAEPVDIVKVESKVREIERLRADLRLSRIRTIEMGKEQLSAAQRKKLEELVTERRFSRSRGEPHR